MPFRSCHPCVALPIVLCLILALSVSAAAGAAQKRGSKPGAAGEAESGPEFTIRVPVNVVPVNVTVTDESGRVSRFPLISLGEGMIYPWGRGELTVAFKLSFKNVQPGQYKLTVMTRAPAAGGQSVIARSALTVAE